MSPRLTLVSKSQSVRRPQWLSHSVSDLTIGLTHQSYTIAKLYCLGTFFADLCFIGRKMVRRKQRYLLAEIIYPNNNMSYDLPVGDVHNAVKGAFEEQFGEYGMALVKSSLSVSLFNKNYAVYKQRWATQASPLL